MKTLLSGIRSMLLAAKQTVAFFHKMNLRPIHLISISGLSMLAAFFEGISVSLLIPTMKGIINMDFNFIREMPVVKKVIAYFPCLLKLGDSSIFIFLVAAVIVTLIIKNVLRYFTSLALCYRAEKFSESLRNTIFSRYLSFGKLFFDRSNKGYLCNIPTNFVNIIGDGLITVQGAVEAIFALVVYLAIMIAISWKFTMVMLIFYPTLHYSLQWVIGKINKTSGLYADATSKLSEKLFNVLSCIPLVKTYANEEREKREFSNISNTVAMWRYSIYKKQCFISPLTESVIHIGLMLCVTAVAFFTIKVRAGDIAGFLVYFYVMKRSASMFGPLNSFRASIAAISGYISRVLEMLDDENKFFVLGGEKKFEGLKKNIEYKNLHFSYMEGLEILKGVSFCIDKGKMTAIVGPTGSGKTSLINLILRFYDCPPSSLFIDGIDIREYSLSSLMPHIALVSQDTLLFNDTLRENIIYGLDKRPPDEEILEIMKETRLYDFVTSLPEGLNTLIGDKGVKLSGGERQRVSIARAIIKGAELLILDEATSSLDTNTEQLIQAAIDKAVKGRTAIVIAHRLSTIKNSDKIIALEKGRLVEQGSLNELLDAKGRFYQYWEEQKFY
ncbi:MAG: ABC transporter ATP-binding protein [Candidatus Omnitrophota bacterium]